jgi:glycerophosphoryl diester phosphodiesterase
MAQQRIQAGGMITEDPALARRVPEDPLAGAIEAMADRADPPRVIAHRGDHRHAAENSLAAFDAAIHGGCDMVETDLRRCRDGIVVCHDARVGGRPVASLSRREIRDVTGNLPVGLDDVVERCRGAIGLNLELKEAGLEAEVLDAVLPYFGRAQYLISSFHAGVLRTVRGLAAEARTGLLSARGLAGLLRSRGLAPDPRSAAAVLAAMRECDADYLIPDALDRELIDRAGAAGATLILWYANTGDEIREALSRPSVAGVITDSPHLVQQALSSRARPGARWRPPDPGGPIAAVPGRPVPEACA